VTAPKRQPEPLDPVVAVALFVLLVVLVTTGVLAIIFTSWQVLVAGIGAAVIVFGYVCLAQNQRGGRPRD